MKKITILAMLFVTIANFGQTKKELKKRSGDIEYLTKLQKKTNAKSLIHAYFYQKVYGLKDVIVLTDDQLAKFGLLVKTEFPFLQDAQKKYLETDSEASKLELMRLIVENEENFRSILTDEQKDAYLKYGNKSVTNVAFEENFMSTETFEKYKKELL